MQWAANSKNTAGIFSNIMLRKQNQGMILKASSKSESLKH